MTSRSAVPFAERARAHPHPLARRLFRLALAKRSTLVLSADVTCADELLEMADRLGPYIITLKTHADIVDGLESAPTHARLAHLARRHGFLLFEDRKFVDIGATVQKQYDGGPLRIADWAHLVNAAVLAGPGIVRALAEAAAAWTRRRQQQQKEENKENKEKENEPAAQRRPEHNEPDNNDDDSSADADTDRALLLLAEMTSAGSLATGNYTAAAVTVARAHRTFVLGFVATRALTDVAAAAADHQKDAEKGEKEKKEEQPLASSNKPKDQKYEEKEEYEDFLIFTTGINLSTASDALGQRYVSPATAVARGADFVITGRGVYAAPDPVAAAVAYRDAAWAAYEERVAGWKG